MVGLCDIYGKYESYARLTISEMIPTIASIGRAMNIPPDKATTMRITGKKIIVNKTLVKPQVALIAKIASLPNTAIIKSINASVIIFLSSKFMNNTNTMCSLSL